jgi:hypothetical protein
MCDPFQTGRGTLFSPIAGRYRAVKIFGCLAILRSVHLSYGSAANRHRKNFLCCFPVSLLPSSAEWSRIVEAFALAKGCAPEPLCQIYGRRANLERGCWDRNRLQLGPSAAGDPYV